MGILVDTSVSNRRDGRSGRVSFQKTTSLVSEISHECTFLLVCIPSEWVLSIGHSSRSSSSTKESSIIVVVNLGREGEMFGHLSFLDQPQSSSDKVNNDRETNDGQQDKRNDDTGDSTSRKVRAGFASGLGIGFLDGRSSWVEVFRAPGGGPSP